MSSTVDPTINTILQQVSIYYGIPAFFLGVIGTFFNVLIFLTSGLVRQKSSVFYLTIMSMFDFGRLWSNTLIHILHYGFDIHLYLFFPYFCKIRVCVLTICMLGSMTCLCLAVFDQFCATSSSPFWQQFCNIKIAHGLIKFFVFIYILHAIPYVVYFNMITSPSTNKTICQITNNRFIQYHTYGYFLFLNHFIPCLTALFSLLAYRNTKMLSQGRKILFRHELDRQFAKMILTHVLIYFLTFLPYAMQSIYALIVFDRNEPKFRAQIEFRSIITLFISVLSFAVSLFALRIKNALIMNLFSLEFILYLHIRLEIYSSTFLFYSL